MAKLKPRMGHKIVILHIGPDAPSVGAPLKVTARTPRGSAGANGLPLPTMPLKAQTGIATAAKMKLAGESKKHVKTACKPLSKTVAAGKRAAATPYGRLI